MLSCVLLLGTRWLAGCAQRDGERNERGPLTCHQRIDRSLSSAARYLCTRQEADGAWRSEQYAPFKDGASLTPLVLLALQNIPESDDIAASYRKGIAYLAGQVKADGSIEEGPHGLSYPVYTAAFTVIVLGDPRHAQERRVRASWLAYLRRRQLTEDLGWQSADKDYGGWGYSIPLPKKPMPGELTTPKEANLSATVCALAALRAAGCLDDDPAYKKALSYLQRLQNYSEDPHPAFDDGGFTFIADDGARNKAGSAGKDRAGHERFRSYGSSTADGLRALRACGLLQKDPRVSAARAWLETNFSTELHPGDYVKEREPNRQAVYFYYAWSASQAFHELGIQKVKTKTGTQRWAEVLADELMKRQRDDGSWLNPAGAQREDDPLVAACLAAAALAVCRVSLTE